MKRDIAYEYKAFTCEYNVMYVRPSLLCHTLIQTDSHTMTHNINSIIGRSRRPAISLQLS